MEFEKLKKIIVDVLNVDENEITMDTTFIDDLGADSLDVFQIIMGLEEEFDIDLWKKDFEKRARAALEKKEPTELDALVSEFEKMEQNLPEADPLRDLYDKMLEARC